MTAAAEAAIIGDELLNNFVSVFAQLFRRRAQPLERKAVAEGNAVIQARERVAALEAMAAKGANNPGLTQQIKQAYKQVNAASRAATVAMKAVVIAAKAAGHSAISEELKEYLRSKTPDSQAKAKAYAKSDPLAAVVGKQDSALSKPYIVEGLDVDHIIPIFTIISEYGQQFARLTFANQLAIANFGENLQVVSSRVNRSRGAKPFGTGNSAVYFTGFIGTGTAANPENPVNPKWNQAMIARQSKANAAIGAEIAMLLKEQAALLKGTR